MQLPEMPHGSQGLSQNGSDFQLSSMKIGSTHCRNILVGFEIQYAPSRLKLMGGMIICDMNEDHMLTYSHALTLRKKRVIM